MAAAASSLQGSGDDSLGLGHDIQSAVLADDDELAADALLQLMPRAVAAAGLLVSDQLQPQGVWQVAGELAEDLSLDQR